MMFSLLDKLVFIQVMFRTGFQLQITPLKKKSPAGRFKLFSEALLPPALSGRWRSVTKKPPPERS